MLSKKVQLQNLPANQQNHAIAYASREMDQPVPKYEMPEGSMSANVAYQIIHDELNLDGNPALNLASFVTTWMEPEAERLMMETLNRNYVDQSEYPQTTMMQDRCVNMLAHLFGLTPEQSGMGTGTVGSSEAIHLAGLSLKWKWRDRRLAAGLSTDKPNIVMGHNVQVCWEKFARYFEVEPRYVPLSKDRYVLGVEEAIERVDENTIGVVGILGSTYTGEYEPIEELHTAIVQLNEKTGWNVPIHVDAASGGFVAAFDRPDLKWDFRLPMVKSINVSGHKYGLVYPGVGWVLWRGDEEVAEDLIFYVNYLGGEQPTFNLNFSRGASQIIAQYYNFLRLGKEGYRKIMANLQDTTRYLVEQIEAMGHFRMLSKLGHLPVIAFAANEPDQLSVFDLEDRLRMRGWIVPAYTLAPNAEDIAVLRVVVRENFSRDMADMLLADIQRETDNLLKGIPTTPKTEPGKKAHHVC